MPSHLQRPHTDGVGGLPLQFLAKSVALFHTLCYWLAGRVVHSRPSNQSVTHEFQLAVTRLGSASIVRITRLGVRQTVSSRNRLSSLNILACSSRSAQPLSRLPPNLGLRRIRLGPSGLDSVFLDLHYFLIMVTYVELFEFTFNEVKELVQRGCNRCRGPSALAAQELTTSIERVTSAQAAEGAGNPVTLHGWSSCNSNSRDGTPDFL